MTIIEELRTNRESGAKRLESEYKAGLMTLAKRFCVDHGDAEELVNRTFAAVVENIDEYLEQSAFFGWMCQILSNIHAKDIRNKSYKAIVYPGTVPEMVDDSAQTQIFQTIDASFLHDAIETLPKEMKEAIIMHYFMEQPVSRVAKFLALPVSTVKWRLHVARAELTRRLGVTVENAVKKPGGKAVLLALLLCGLTALGAAVWNLAGSGEAQDTSIGGGEQKGGGTRPAAQNSNFRQESTSKSAMLPALSGNIPSFSLPQPSNLSTDNSQGETMNIAQTSRAAAMLAAATVATSAATPATAGADQPQPATAITAYSGGFTLDTRPSPQISGAEIEPFSTMPLAFVITIR